jgi:hypothetical protein
MKKLLKNTLRGRCTYFFFRYSPEKIPSHNTVYLARSCPRSTHICQKLIDFQRNFGKHQIYAKRYTKLKVSPTQSLHLYNLIKYQFL